MMIKVTQSGSFNFVISQFRNIAQNKGQQIFIQQFSSTSGTVIRRIYFDNYANVITIDPSTSEPLNITFTPTLTPDYQLKYQFPNIARVEITHLLQNDNIQMIRLDAPSGINIDTTYCNATMETFTNEALPYPYRYKCTTMSSTYIVLNMQSNFPTWNSTFTNRKVIIHIRYTIPDWYGAVSPTWYVRSYSHPTSNSGIYQISQATGTFNILNYQSPFLYKVNFNTKAFSKRTCHIN